MRLFRNLMPTAGVLSLFALALSSSIAVAAPPIAVNDSFTIAVDALGEFDVLANDQAPGGGALEIISNTDPSAGFLSCDGVGTCLYLPDGGWTGRTSFNYTVANALGETATATVRITVGTPGNTAPVAGSDKLTVDEDAGGSIAALANDSDADGDTLTIIGATQPAHGSVLCSLSSCDYTPTGNYNGPDAFTYTIADGNAGTAVGSVAVTVNAINDAPVALPDQLTLNQNSSASVSVVSNDTDLENDMLIVSTGSNGSNGAVSCAAGSCTYTPKVGFSGLDSFTYTVGDGNGGTATGTVSVTVKVVTPPPPPPPPPAPSTTAPLNVAIAADAASVAKGSSTGYTITIKNPNTAPVVVTKLADCLPKGFSYLRNSTTTGAFSGTPRIVGTCGHGSTKLVWTQRVTVPAGQSVTMHFGVHVGGPRGVAYNRAFVKPEGMDVVMTGATAPIKVTHGRHGHR
jgi:uncharacterized repeat protein (TIGR01451 family)